MTFEEILDQAMAMLQRRGRIAYRTLKRQFQLDDEALEDLKTELIKAQRLAQDEDGDVLVWTGGRTRPEYPPRSRRLLRARIRPHIWRRRFSCPRSRSKANASR
jgi:hypothetical protein